MRRNRAVEQSNGMQSNLQYARGQAAATRSYVSICPMVAGGAQTCDVGATYDNGWLIYTASAPNTAYDASVAGSLQLAVAAPTNTSIIANTAGVLTYNALGELLTPGESQPGTNVTFRYLRRRHQRQPDQYRGGSGYSASGFEQRSYRLESIGGRYYLHATVIQGRRGQRSNGPFPMAVLRHAPADRPATDRASHPDAESVGQALRAARHRWPRFQRGFLHVRWRCRPARG